MKISQSLPRPENWQDFETLCKKLWGEVWNCPETKKNGRSGQDQSGIDVCGMPDGTNFYIGIQCKGKDEYTNKQLTKKEIDEEIAKAMNFKPKLKKMYFATTAIKDAKIEEYIREKNIEHIENGLFEVHLYAWEEIVELIQENKTTYDFYLNSNSFKTNQSVKVTFENGNTEITVRPKFLRIIRVGKTRREEFEREAANMIPQWLKEFQDRQNIWDQFNTHKAHIVTPSKPRTKFNRSLFDATVLVSNNGSQPLEHWKLIVKLPKQVLYATFKNCEKIQRAFIPSVNSIQFDTHIDKRKHLVELEPRKKILVGDDIFSSDQFFLKTLSEEMTLELPWKFISKNFKTEGKLTITVVPEWEIKTIKVPDDSPLLLDENERVTIEDYIESIDDD